MDINGSLRNIAVSIFSAASLQQQMQKKYSTGQLNEGDFKVYLGAINHYNNTAVQQISQVLGQDHTAQAIHAANGVVAQIEQRRIKARTTAASASSISCSVPRKVSASSSTSSNDGRAAMPSSQTQLSRSVSRASTEGNRN